MQITFHDNVQCISFKFHAFCEDWLPHSQTKGVAARSAPPMNSPLGRHIVDEKCGCCWHYTLRCHDVVSRPDYLQSSVSRKRQSTLSSPVCGMARFVSQKCPTYDVSSAKYYFFYTYTAIEALVLPIRVCGTTRHQLRTV